MCKTLNITLIPLNVHIFGSKKMLHVSNKVNSYIPLKLWALPLHGFQVNKEKTITFLWFSNKT